MIKLFFLHFLADFILQPREMGKKKSSDFRWLFGHLAIQFLVFLPFVGWRLSLMNALAHGIIDRNIWNLYKFKVKLQIKKEVNTLVKNAPLKFYKEWEQHPEWKINFIRTKTEQAQDKFQYWEYHWFYATIGLDQFLHAATLLYLFG